MTTKNLALVTAFGLASWIVTASSAQAVVVSNQGDLLLAFRTTGGSNTVNLTVDLGPADTIFNLGPGIYNLNVGGFLGSSAGLSVFDLRTAYGNGTTDASWNTISDLAWSVAGASGGASNNILYVTTPTAIDTLTRAAAATQNTGAKTRLDQIRQGISGLASTPNSPQSAVVSISDPNVSYSEGIRNGNPGSFTSDYNYTNWGSGAQTTEGLVVSSGASNLDFFRVRSGSGTETSTSFFSLGSDGTFTYTVVPEPSTAVLVALASAALVGLRRRRQSVSN
jgi:hypothetical protein